jgi:ATP-dependent RNA helicase DeaD
MNEVDLASTLGPALASALDKKGYETLTTVQQAVLDPALADRDLRLTSQTGSGKTVAIGFVLRDVVKGGGAGVTTQSGTARPRALVIAPTRELARQVEEELKWLYAGTTKVLSVAGGKSFRDERHALVSGIGIIVATPGRLLDHLTRGSIDPKDVGAVVLDEADRLLDLGFREDLEKILAMTPEGRRTHLMSATFPRDVKALADHWQKAPAHVEGTRLGVANSDIDHVVYLSDPRERVDAIVNLLLSRPDEQTLIFCRTRADVARVARELGNAGFGVSSLSGEMEQPARDRALAGFKRGDLRILVATDVAARGLDVQDITFVIHADPPDDPDTYTHRSGRTGRAGRKGTSCVMIAPAGLRRVSSLLARARIQFRIEALPTAQSIREMTDERLCEELLAPDPEGFAGFDDRTWGLAKRIAEGADATRTIARLILRARRSGPTEPRAIRSFAPPTGRDAGRDWEPRGDRDYERNRPPPRYAPAAKAPVDRPSRTRAPAAHHTKAVADRPSRTSTAGVSAIPAERPSRARATLTVPSDRPSRTRAPSSSSAIAAERPSRARAPAHHEGDDRPARPMRPREDRAPKSHGAPGDWVPFKVTWGELHGADARRLLAVACRRGGVDGKDIGAIRLGPTWSTLEVSAKVADTFAAEAAKPDERNPRVQFERNTDGSTPPPRTGGFNSRPPPPHAKSKRPSWGDKPLPRRK